jgi:putative hydrolase of the HAD superfamily
MKARERMPAIQVVLFDLGGTLLHYDQPPERSFERLNASALLALLKASAAAGTRVADPEMAVRAVGRMAAAIDAKSRRTLYSNTAETIIWEGLEAIGVHLPPAAWDAGLVAYYASISAEVTPVDGDAPAVLAHLVEQGRTLGMVSNTLWAPALHDQDLERFGLFEYLPVRVYSSVSGYIKPHPQIYRKALDALNVAPAEAIFVGDRLDVDVAGPQKIGLRAVLVDSPYRSDAPDAETRPDAHLRTIDELPALLDEWERALEITVPGT